MAVGVEVCTGVAVEEGVLLKVGVPAMAVFVGLGGGYMGLVGDMVGREQEKVRKPPNNNKRPKLYAPLKLTEGSPQKNQNSMRH